MHKKIRCLLLLPIFVLSALISPVTNFQTKTEDEVIKVDTNLVTVPVIVSDRQNRYIAGLKAENFAVFQDGNKQSIEYFIAEEAPINVAILLDTSRSTELVLGKIKKAAQDFVKQLKPDDRCLVISFDWQVNVLSELTNDHEKLKKAIKNAAIGAQFGTVLQDALYQTITRSLAGVKGRKAVILLTDGKDFGSYIEKNELIYKLEESDTLVYSIFYDTALAAPRMMPSQFPFPNRRNPFPNRRGGVYGRGGGGNPERRRQRIEQSNEAAIDFLRELAEVTAGRFYQKSASDLKEAFEAITEELRKQYLIGFYPEKVETGKIYQIKVKVDRNDAVVRSKNAFRLNTAAR